jgi:hypothetical protein
MFKSIQARSTLILGLLATLSFALATWLIQSKAAFEQTRAAQRELQAIAEAQAGHVQRLAETPLAFSRALAAAAVAEIGTTEPDRGRMLEVVHQFALSDRRSLGYWIEFEREGFDARDAEHAGRGDLASSDTGRFSIYWVRDEAGAVALE